MMLQPTRILMLLTVLTVACYDAPEGGTAGGSPTPDCNVNAEPIPHLALVPDAGRTNTAGYPWGVTIYPTSDGGSAFSLEISELDAQPDTCWRLQLSVALPEGGTRRVLDEARRFTTPGPVTVHFTTPEAPDAWLGKASDIRLQMTSTEAIVDATPFGDYAAADINATRPPETPYTACEPLDNGGRLVMLGERVEDGFETYDATRPAAVTWGFQGSEMITPNVLLSNASEEDACVFVALTHRHPDGSWLDHPATGRWLPLSELARGALVSEALFEPIDDVTRVLDAGAEIQVEVTVASARFWIQDVVWVPIRRE